MAENQNGEPYSFQSLQEEAIRRAREMQARARVSPSVRTPPARDEPPRAPEPREPRPDAEQTPPPAPTYAPDPGPAPAPEEDPPEGDSGLLELLLKDNERTLIWVLLLILIEEKADTALLLALMYLAT